MPEFLTSIGLLTTASICLSRKELKSTIQTNFVPSAWRICASEVELSKTRAIRRTRNLPLTSPGAVTEEDSEHPVCCSGIGAVQWQEEGWGSPASPACGRNHFCSLLSQRMGAAKEWWRYLTGQSLIKPYKQMVKGNLELSQKAFQWWWCIPTGCCSCGLLNRKWFLRWVFCYYQFSPVLVYRLQTSARSKKKKHRLKRTRDCAGNEAHTPRSKTLFLIIRFDNIFGVH